MKGAQKLRAAATPRGAWQHLPLMESFKLTPVAELQTRTHP
jgi:hypothetical protein